MNCKVEFLVNNKLEIEVNDEIYKSNIQDIGEDYIGISIPVNNGKYLPLTKGEEVTGTYYCGKDIYRFATVVIGRKIDRILIIILKKPESLELFQRRNFVRVPLMIDVFCALICEDKNICNVNDNQVEFFNAYSIDISGGGMKVVLDSNLRDKVDYGDILMVTIPQQDDNLTVKGRIMRINNDKKNPKIICGLSFIDLDKNTRERIIGLVFKTMREQMRKGAKGD